MNIISLDKFDINEYELLYRSCEIAIYKKLPDFRWSPTMGEDRPVFIMTYQGELIEHLYLNNLLGGDGYDLVSLLSTAYKEIFFAHFERRERWQGRALENSLAMAIGAVNGSRIYDKCVASHWATKYQNPLSHETITKTNYINKRDSDVQDYTRFSGSKRVLGVTPINGRQSDSRLAIELVISRDNTSVTRGSSEKGIFPRKKLVMAHTPLYGERLVTFDELVMNNLELINLFIDQTNKTRKK